MKSFSLLLFFLIIPVFLSAQNLCGDFENYRESQNWIKELKQKNSDQIKTELIARIKCEQDITLEQLDYDMFLIYNGLLITTLSDIPKIWNEAFQNIPAKYFRVEHSMCENENIFVERCGLGFIILNDLNQSIFNEIYEISSIESESKKDKLTFTIIANSDLELNLRITDFLNTDKVRYKKQKLNKGFNKFTINNPFYFSAVEFIYSDQKALIFN